MFASFVNDVDNATDGEMKTEAFRKLIEFHMDIKGYEMKLYAISFIDLIQFADLIFKVFPGIERCI